jgi:hypothetical protein
VAGRVHWIAPPGLPSGEYAQMEEEHGMSEEDIAWLLAHTEYDDKELNTMLYGIDS